MKKNFLKKLAFTMAFATAFTALSPAAGVFAAKAPSLTVGKTLTLLLGTEDRASHDINVNNKVPGSKYAWKSNNTKVATVNAKNGIVTGKTTGTAKVTLSITLPGVKKAKTLTTTVNVKDNIKELAVKVKEAEIKDNKLQKTLVAGEVVDFDRTIVSTFGGNTKAHKGAITRWEVLDADKKETTKASADDTGLFVATEPGTYLVSAVSFQSKAKYNEWLKSGDAKLVTARAEAVEVTVAASITSVKQLTPNEIQLTFDADMSKVVNKDNLIIEVNDATKQKQIVEKVTFADADGGLKATVKTYLDFKDAVVYTVNVDKTALTGEFKASKGEAVRIEITGPKTVVFGKETAIEYGIYDANDVKIATTGADLSITEGNADAYLNNGKINIFEKDKTVVVKARYSTNKIDPEKYELIYLEAVATITSREAVEAVVTGSKNTVAKTAPNWDDFKANNRIGLGDTGYKLFVQLLVNEDGTDKKVTDTATTKFDYESQDLTKLVVGADGTLVPFATGTVHVKVTYGKLTVIVPVVIGAERKAVSWKFEDGNSKQVSNAVGVADKAVFKALATDNYDASFPVDKIKVTAIGTAPLAPVESLVNGEVLGDTITINGETFGDVPGTYQYKVEFAGLASMVTVVVRDGINNNTVATRKIDAGSVKLDAARRKDHEGDEKVTLALLGYNSAGVLVSRETNYTISKIDAPSANGTAGTIVGKDFILASVTGSPVSISGVSYNVIDKAKAGNYLYKAEMVINGETKEVARTVIVVEDTQANVTLAQTKVSTAKKNVLEIVTDAFDAYVGSDKVDDNRILSVEARKADGTLVDHNATVTAGTLVITKVTVAQTFTKGNDNFVVIREVTVNRAVTITN